MTASDGRASLSWTQVAAAAAASATGFALATRLGVLGTVIGSALIATVATIAGSLLEDSLDRSRERLRNRTAREAQDQVARPEVPPATQSSLFTTDELAATNEPEPGPDATESLPAGWPEGAGEPPSGSGLAPLTWRSKRIWVPIALAAAMGAGAILAGLSGQAEPRRPSSDPAPTATTTQTVVVTATPSATPTSAPTVEITATPLPTTTPTLSPSPEPTTTPEVTGEFDPAPVR